MRLPIAPFVLASLTCSMHSVSAISSDALNAAWFDALPPALQHSTGVLREG
jgi:hypothetical protein